MLDVIYLDLDLLQVALQLLLELRPECLEHFLILPLLLLVVNLGRRCFRENF